MTERVDVIRFTPYLREQIYLNFRCKGMDTAAIAEALQVPEDAVYNALSRERERRRAEVATGGAS